MKRKWWLVLCLFVLGSILLGSGFYLKYQQEKENTKKKQSNKQQQSLVKSMKDHYSSLVVITKDSALYQFVDKKYQKKGSLSKGMVISLEEVATFQAEVPYFKIKDSSYYVPYEVVIPTKEQMDQRYLKYVPFDLKIITQAKSTFMNRSGEVLFQLDSPVEATVIENEEDFYGISLFSQLVFVPKEQVVKVVEQKNSQVETTSRIATILYHFIYLTGDSSCQEMICHSEDQIRSHFGYLKEQGYMTLTTDEMLKFITGSLRFPKKSLLITIDDGARVENFLPFLEEYKLNATLFLVSSWYPKEKFASPYLEIASHTHNMHDTGVCPTGQGGGINCLSEDVILKDLKASRDTLNQTVALSFPFYEYSDYSIELVKRAGFKISFIGGSRKVTPGIDPYKVPRYTVQSMTNVARLEQIVS